MIVLSLRVFCITHLANMYQFIIFCVIVLYLFHALVYHKYNWPSYVRMINKIPGPKGVLFFGSALKYYRLKHEGT